MTEQGGIHDEHPFDTPMDQRDPARRFRGRLASAVTVVTAGTGERQTGLTVSSIMIAEGEPSRVYFLVGTTTDLYYVLEERGRFVVHVLQDRHHEISDVFAGLRPSPGGRFAGLSVEDSDWGPVLSDVATRAYCTFEGGDEETYFLVAEGVIDKLELGDVDDPLVYFRGKYRSLG